MLKNCTKCNSRHTAPFGSRCKTEMAVIEGFSRDDPKYLKQLEDEYCELKQNAATAAAAMGGGKVKAETDLPTKADMIKVMDSLHQITDRISKLETGTDKHKPDPGDAGLSAATLITAPLTKALAKLTGEEDERGKVLRPETYSQHDLKEKGRDHNKLDTIGLFYGWVCVAQHLMEHGGNLPSYMRHIRYATEMLHTRQFYDVGAIKYDRLIIDRYLEGKAAGFDPDPVISSLTFSSKIIPDSVDLCPGASLTKGVTSYIQTSKSTGRGRRRNPTTRRSDEIPTDFPQDICFMYNYRFCGDENCSKSHVCRKCSGKHRADNCREKTRKS